MTEAARVSIDALRGKPEQVLTLVESGPVVIEGGGDARGVIISHDLWVQLLDRLEDAEDLVAVLSHRLDPEPTEPFRGAGDGPDSGE